MSPVLEIDGRQVWSLTIRKASEFDLPLPQHPYPCLIWSEMETSSDFKLELSKKLIKTDCRYIVAGGIECSLWDDAGDFAFIASNDDYDPPDEQFVMTSWHEGESLVEVVRFFALNTNFDRHDFRHFLIVHIGESQEMEFELIEAIRKIWTHHADTNAV